MNQETERLQELLARVQRNAALPRLAAAQVAAASPAAPAYVAPAPAYAAPKPPAYVAPAFIAEEAFFATGPAAYEAEPLAGAAPLDASVDDLLLEDPFPSAPAPPLPSSSDGLSEAPIPLVSLASPRSVDDEGVSGVMVISEVTQDQPEELLDDDIVEMTPDELTPDESAEAMPRGQNGMDDLNFDDEELDRDSGPRSEEPPASSSRSRIAGTMDEALAHAASQIEHDEGREVPLQTPPPESGPQEAMALPMGIHAPLSPDIEELLEADILPKGGVNAARPTAEQLGQTIDLEEARGPSLELDRPATFAPEPLQEELLNEELEVNLPQREFGGGYQDNLMPPPEARQELDAHLQRFSEESVPPAPGSMAQAAPQQPEASSHDFAPVIVPAAVTTDSYSESVSTVTVEAPASAEFAPELLQRPELNPSPVAKFMRVEAPRPNTFLEMLDASLSLGRDHY